jgi:hypothetical protein
VAYAVETCSGWQHDPDGKAMDALGQPRCDRCGWSWGAHRSYGRPHPPAPPPDYDMDDPAIIALWQIDDDDEPAAASQGEAQEA